MFQDTNLACRDRDNDSFYYFNKKKNIMGARRPLLAVRTLEDYMK